MRETLSRLRVFYKIEFSRLENCSVKLAISHQMHTDWKVREGAHGVRKGIEDP